MSYLVRLSLVCAAVFFLVHLALAIAASTTAPWLTRRALRMRPAAGARLLFMLRMLPWAASALLVATLCIPSYLRFEHDAAEGIGLPCLILAGLCMGMAIFAVVRGAWALLAVARLAAQPGEALFALVGFLRPHLMISAAVRNALSAAQLEVAMLHEEAHRCAGDNWKRLAMVVTPNLGFRQLEAEWARLAEWAADDAAVQARPLQAVALAEAMLCVARLAGGRYEGSAPVSALVAGNDDLGQRVQRLLEPAAIETRQARWPRIATVLSLAAMCVAILSSASILSVVHSAMERLVQ